MFEDIGVFRRLGEETDVVTKEMYDFVDKGDRHIALRPEGTASVVRAFVQHRPVTPWKAWYATPAFRYESPQSGRLRQHHQVGIEAIGSADPDLDVEVIALGHDYLRAARPAPARAARELDGQPARTASATPTRLRGWLTERVGRPRRRGPAEGRHEPHAGARQQAAGHPGRSCATRPRSPRTSPTRPSARFERVTGGLGALGIDFQLEPRLVRGLDYYTHTTFELQSEAIDAAQSTVLAGGRYDGLVEDLGGPPTPGIGFGSGIERVLLACDAEGVFPAPASTARRVRGRRDRRRGRPGTSPPSCAAPASAPTAPSTPAPCGPR